MLLSIRQLRLVHSFPRAFADALIALNFTRNLLLCFQKLRRYSSAPIIFAKPIILGYYCSTTDPCTLLYHQRSHTVSFVRSCNRSR
jgi:hypothetical protein